MKKRIIGILLVLCLIFSTVLVGTPVVAENTPGKMLKCLLGTSSDTSKTHYGQFRTPKFSVQSGKTYDVSFDYYLDGAVAGGYGNATNCAQNYVRIYSDKGYITTTDMLDTSNENLNYFTPGLHHFTASFTASRNETTARILIRQLYNGTLYYSDFTVVEQGTTTNLLSNGDFSNGLTGYYYVGGGEQGEFGQSATGVWATVYEVVDYGQPIGEPGEQPGEESETSKVFHFTCTGSGDAKLMCGFDDKLQADQTYTLKLKYYIVKGSFYIQGNQWGNDSGRSGARNDKDITVIDLGNAPTTGEIVSFEKTVTTPSTYNYGGGELTNCDTFDVEIRTKGKPDEFYIWDLGIYDADGKLVDTVDSFTKKYCPTGTDYAVVDYKDTPMAATPGDDPTVDPQDPEEPSGEGVCAHEYGKDGICTKCHKAISAWHFVSPANGAGDGKFLMNAFDDLPLDQTYTLKLKIFAVKGGLYVQELYDELNTKGTRHDGNQLMNEPLAAGSVISKEFEIEPQNNPSEYTVMIRNKSGENDYYVWDMQVYTKSGKLVANTTDMRALYTPANVTLTKTTYDQIPIPDDTKEPAWHITAPGAAGGNGKLIADVFDGTKAGNTYTLKLNYIASSGRYNAYANPSTNTEPGNSESMLENSHFNKVGSVQEYSISYTASKDNMKVAIRDVGGTGDITDIYFWNIRLYDSDGQLLAKATKFFNDAYTPTVSTKMYFEDVPIEELEKLGAQKYAYKFDFTQTTGEYPSNFYFVKYGETAKQIYVRFKYYNVQLAGIKTDTIVTNVATSNGNYTEATPIEYGSGEYEGICPVSPSGAWTMVIQQNIPDESGNGRSTIYIWDVEYSTDDGTTYKSMDELGFAPQKDPGSTTTAAKLTKIPVEAVPTGCVHNYNDKGLCTICHEYLQTVCATFGENTVLNTVSAEELANAAVEYSFDYFMTAADSYPTVLGQTLLPGEHSFHYANTVNGTFAPEITANGGTLYIWNVTATAGGMTLDFNAGGSTATVVSAAFNTLPFVLGDANNDAETDVRDIVRIKRILNGTQLDFYLRSGDVNKNKKADADDLSDMRKIVLGKFAQKHTEAEKEAFLDKTHYTIAGDPSDLTTYIYQLGSMEDCGLYIREALFDNGNPDDDENPVEIVLMNDLHFNYYNDDDIAENNPALMSTIKYRDWPEITKALANADRALNYGDYFDQIIINGDVLDYLSRGGLELMRTHIWNKYPGTLCTIGNHEPARQMQGTVADTTTMESRMQILQDNWEHDIYYTSKVLKDKVMVIQMCNGNGCFYNSQIPLLTADLQTARDNGYTVFAFFHMPIGTGNEADRCVKTILTKSGESDYRDFVGDKDGVTGTAPDGKQVKAAAINCDRDQATRKVYDLLTNNGDVIKGFFSAHTHNDYYLEVNGKTPDGADVKIPQYVVGGMPYNNGELMKITVK